MASRNAGFLEQWHRIVDEKDLAALEKVLAEDVSLGAPPYWEAFQGRPLVHFLLGRILHAIEDLTYHREWHDDSRGGGEIALEFRGHVGDLDVQGIDLITLDDRGALKRLDVMIRPMNALEALRDVVAPQMVAFLREQS